LTADALHLAAPFRVNSASPLFSPTLFSEPPAAKRANEKTAPGTRVTSRDVQSRDVQLDAREVFNLQSSARLIMLSDPAALSVRDASRGIAPIQWAWRATGAATLIFRRWGGG
jgi:hypothetical protein